MFRITPPNIEDKECYKIKREDFKLALKGLLRNKNYINLLISASLMFGSFTGLAVAIAFLV